MALGRGDQGNCSSMAVIHFWKELVNLTRKDNSRKRIETWLGQERYLTRLFQDFLGLKRREAVSTGLATPPFANCCDNTESISAHHETRETWQSKAMSRIGWRLPQRPASLALIICQHSGKIIFYYCHGICIISPEVHMSDFEWYHGIAIAALISVLCYMDYEEALDIPEFHGDDLWENGFLKQCLFPVNAPSDLSCFTFRVEFENVKVEVLSLDPILLVYHQFASQHEIKNFLADAQSREMSSLKVYRGEGDESVSRHREANGTNFFHEEGAGIAAVFRKVEKSIPAVDFQTSEQWQVLSYKPGGHYVPHHDYYDYESEDYWDDTMRNFGNRFATLLLVLKTADQGGETVYPLLQRTITPEAGDVLFWTDLDRLGQGNYNSLHGACPILGGEKIAATLWIRERGQAMMINDEKSRLFDIESLTKPRIRST
ncbi:hypothetical protein Y032_0032g2543 [Ancylostoma ceylanicum]|nr:hypothetical protein Y032_0032g2543 [Ancylostoma ceylanicum]